MGILSYILWQPDPEIFTIGSWGPRWYGLLFAAAFYVGYETLSRIFKKEGKPANHVDTIFLYVIIATVLGARLGHCLFYQPDFYLSNPIEILKIWEGGLASHGAAFGIIFAIYLFTKKYKEYSFLYIIDRVVITIAIGGCFIRFGNLMNSEIVGMPTDNPMAFVFAYDGKSWIKDNNTRSIKEVTFSKAEGDTTISGIKHPKLKAEIITKKGVFENEEAVEVFVNDQVLLGEEGLQTRMGFKNEYIAEHLLVNYKYANIHAEKLTEGKYRATFYVYGVPRHPAQLYESLSSLAVFLLLLFIYSRKKGLTPDGRLFGTFLVVLFSLRFFYEFLKENQVEFEDELTLNMGQILSVPLVLIGVFILARSFKLKKKEE